MLLSALFTPFKTSYTGRDPYVIPRLEWWMTHLGAVEVASITTDQCDAVLVALAQRGAMRNIRGKGAVATGKPLNPATLNRYRAALASLFKWGKRVKLLPRSFASPLRDLPPEQENEGSTVYLTEEQVGMLMAAARVMRWRKMPALLLLAFHSGLRAGAIESIRWGDVDLKRRRINVPRTKNGDPYTVHLTEACVAELAAIPGDHDRDRLVFESAKGNNLPHDYRHTWNRLFEVTGIPYVKFHAMRHSCASHAAMHGATEVMLMNLLGHKSLAMVKRYSHLNIDARASFVDRVFAGQGVAA